MWTIEQRNVYQYQLPNGDKRFADPLLIRRKLTQATAAKIDEFVVGQCSDDPLERTVADEAVARAVQKAFGLPAFDSETGDGATDQYLLDLFEDFQDWLEKKNQSGVTSPTMPQPG